MSDLSKATRPTRAPSRNESGATHNGSRAHVPNVPDPQRDEHVAFPERDHHGFDGAVTAAAPSGSSLPHALPGSAWVEPPERTARPSRSLLETPPTYPKRTKVPQRLAGLAAFVMVGGVVIGAVNRSGGDVEPGAGLSGDQQYAASVDNRGFIDDDESVVAMPSSFTKLRLELAGADNADLEVSSSRVSYEQPVDLPLRRDLSGQAVRGGTFGVKVIAGGPEQQLQCRLYADDRLVKIDTGDGSVDCSVSVPKPSSP